MRGDKFVVLTHTSCYRDVLELPYTNSLWYTWSCCLASHTYQSKTGSRLHHPWLREFMLERILGINAEDMAVTLFR
jgi:hypothetical protein